MINANQQPVTYANDQIAELLEETAELLEAQGANQFRVRAYRNAAETLRKTVRPVGDILSTEGLDGLKELAGIGDSLARSIEQLTVITARLGKLKGQRIVRGREPDCVRYYDELGKQLPGFNVADSQPTGRATP